MLTQEEQLTLLDLAESSIQHGLAHSQPLSLQPTDFSSPLQARRACFVTLTINDVLRGCIGHLEACQSVVEDVVENAYSAAFRDPRFPALTPSEFKQIQIHISLLTIPSPLDVSSEADLLSKLRPGIDGVILREGFKQATFLPAVWEQLSEPEEFIRHLKIKAGLSGNYWSDNIEIQLYQAESIGH